MTPNSGQQITLKKYLRKTLKYRETYEEVYDHILSALEYEPADVNFEEAVNRIIRNDFGSHNNLLLLETANKKMVVSDMRRKYGNFLLMYFKYPALLYTLGCTLTFYWLISGTRHTVFLFSWPLLFLLGASTCLTLLRYTKIGYVFGDTKKSVKDMIFASIARWPFSTYCFANIYIVLWHHSVLLNYLSPPIGTLIYLIATIHLLAVIKLYQQEFNALTANKY